ncbi:MAG: DUF3108 domain-containing protein [Stenotrophobium sp.]
MRKLIWMTLFFASAACAADAPPAAPASAAVATASDVKTDAKTDAAIALLKTGSMSFDVTWNGFPLGNASITLSPAETRGCYKYESVTNPVGPVRWLYGSPHEISLFCIRDGIIRPSHYQYSIDKRPDDGFTLDFDWTSKTVKTVKSGKTTVRDLPDIAYDRFGLQQAIRLWVMQQPDTTRRSEAEFMTVDAKDINHYRFAILGHEKIDTPVGSFDTIRVDRIDSTSRSTHSWVAPARDYHVIKVESLHDGNVELSMVINK